MKPKVTFYPILPAGGALCRRNVGPYNGCEYLADLEFPVGKGKNAKPRKFKVCTYQAYNAMGLIDTEEDGIAILDEDMRRVLCDRIAKTGSGWGGVPASTVQEFIQIVKLSWPEFRLFIDANPRTRYQI